MMKKIVSLSVLASVMSLAVAQESSVDAFKYTLNIGEVSTTLKTPVGKQVTYSTVTRDYFVQEINSSDAGDLQNVIGTRLTGLETQVTPIAVQEDGRVLTVLAFVLWDQGVQKAKGTHSFKINYGQSVVLPGMADNKLLTIKVALANRD